jgi:putative endonuclease
MIPPPDCPVAGSGGERPTRGGYVYLLKSMKTGARYLGWTADLERRIHEHAAGRGSHTKSRGPWRLIGYECYATMTEAKDQERRLKKSPRMRQLFTKRLENRALAARPALRGTSQVVG